MIAQIKSVPKDTLIGEHLRRSRQTRLTVASALLTLMVLLAASVTAAWIAISQRDQAIRQATISEAGQAAAVAESLTGSNLDLAELLAAEAYKLYPDSQTRAALFQTVTADPHLMRYLQARGTVSAVAGSADANTAVAGTASGYVLRWDLADFKQTLVEKLPAAVSDVAVSADGSTIAATDGSAAEIWARGRGTRSVPIPPRWTATAAAVSPSGRYAAFSISDPSDKSCYLILVDERTGRSSMGQIADPFGGPYSELSFDGETQLVLLNASAGYWERIAIPTLAKLRASQAQTGAQVYAATLSPTGGLISFTNGRPPLLVWDTLSRVPSSLTPAVDAPLGARLSGSDPDALAISADGLREAEADAGTIYILNITTYAKAASSPQLALTGNKEINPNGLSFVGNGSSELLSASNDLIALWDLNQSSRISATVSAEIPVGCDACGGPAIYVSPKENTAIVTAADGTAVAAGLPLSRGHVQPLPWKISSAGAIDPEYGPVVWFQDGQGFSIFTPSNGSGEIWSAAGRLAFLREWAIQPVAPGRVDGGPASAILAADGKQIVEVNSAGSIVLRNPETGAVDHVVRGPFSLSMNGNAYQYFTAADPEGEYAAIVGGAPSGPAAIVNINTGAITTLPGGSVSRVAYDGELLLVQRGDGTFEVRSADGQRLIRSFAGVADPVAGPVVSVTGLAVEVDSGGNASVFDVNSGQEVGSLAIPGGSLYNAPGIAFSPDGNHLVAATASYGGSDGPGQVTEWTFSPALWSKIACASAGHELTLQDWQEYVGPSDPVMPGNMACGP